MEAIRKAGKSLKDLSDCQLIVVAQNLLDGGRFILDIIAKLDEELTRMGDAGLDQTPEFQLMVQKFMGMADQLDNIGFEGDEVREELILRSEVLSTK